MGRSGRRGRLDEEVDEVDICRIHSSMNWDCAESYIDSAVSGGIDVGSERAVQLRQWEHAPGFAHIENGEVLAPSILPPLYSIHPGQVHPPPQLHAEGRGSPLETRDSALIGIPENAWSSVMADLENF